MPADVSSRIPPPPWFQHLLPIDLPPAKVDVVSAEQPAPTQPATPSPREFGFGALSAICNAELVDRVLGECGRLERRCRLLPARLVVYALLLMCLHPALGYQKLMHHLAEAAPTPGRWPIPNKSSFARARVRLGTEVMERLFRALARPLADERAEGCWWRGRRVMAVDGSTGELADNPELEAAFGGPTTNKGRRTGPPQARVVGLVECGTRALVDVAIGRFRDGESRLAVLLVRSITSGMLLLADRNFPSVRLWRLFTKAGADLLWRAKEPVANRVVSRLDDGSYLAKFGDGKQALTVRVIEYTLPGSTTIYRLLTSLLDPAMAPAHELAALYAERWEIEICYGELKVVQWALRALRSLTPDGVHQEFWAHCTLYQVSRQLVYQAAMETPDRDCDRISFSAVQDALRRGARLATGLTVRRVAAALRAAIRELTAARALLKRRDRVCPRVTRHKQPRHPSRARYTGPAATVQARRPEIILCA
jgi:hypothetical protein